MLLDRPHNMLDTHYTTFQPFSISDNGREVQITAGFKNLLPTPFEDKGKTSLTGNSSLFDVIEDVEEKPVHTPL